MRVLRYTLWPAGLAFGVVAEWVGHPELLALDTAAGFLLAAAGLVVWTIRPTSWAGPLTALAGAAWFVGTFGGWPLYLHRAVLAHLILVYPGAKLLPPG